MSNLSGIGMHYTDVRASLFSKSQWFLGGIKSNQEDCHISEDTDLPLEVEKLLTDKMHG